MFKRILFLIALFCIFVNKLSIANANILYPDRLKIVLVSDLYFANYSNAYSKTPAKIIERTFRENGLPKIQVIDRSYNDYDSYKFRQLIEQIANLDIDLVLLQIGYNDMRKSIDIKHLYENLSYMIKYLKFKKINVILVGMLPIATADTKYINSLDKMYLYLASKNKIPFIKDSIAPIRQDKSIYDSDNIHLNTNGVELMSKYIVDSIKPIVQSLYDYKYLLKGKNNNTDKKESEKESNEDPFFDMKLN